MAIAPASVLIDLCGPRHSNLECLERELHEYRLRAESQGGSIRVDGLGEGPEIAERALDVFRDRIDAGAEASCFEFEGIIRSVRAENARCEATGSSFPVRGERIILPGLRKPVSARSAGQCRYMESLTSPDTTLTFALGVAGTGKTYLAVAAGVSALMTAAVERLVVARPAVEAGERLGFLPGDMADKVDPYMLPIWDCLRDAIGGEETERRRVSGQIELAPLAFMRGRTIGDAVIVVDEAQNATRAQMRMILTRLGRGSRMIVVGDPSQSDLLPGEGSALGEAARILERLTGVDVIHLGHDDIVRHDLVGSILRAYQDSEASS